MQDPTENQQIQKLQIKSDFYKALIQELCIHSLKIIEDYQKIIEQKKNINSINPELKGLNHHIMGVYYSDINSKKQIIKIIRSNFKAFNKTYNKRFSQDIGSKQY